jgi:hypothetical protein
VNYLAARNEVVVFKDQIAKAGNGKTIQQEKKEER